MKIHYRKPTLLEQMNNAIAVSAGPNVKPIDYFELTGEELNANYSNLDRSSQPGGVTQYSYKGIPIKVKE